MKLDILAFGAHPDDVEISGIKSVTNHEETILQVDLTNNDDVKNTINLLESNIKETKNPNVVIRLERRLAKLKAKAQKALK